MNSSLPPQIDREFAINLQNQFLIAMPGLMDPSFDGTVTLICEHNDEGAMGVTINRPTDLRLVDVFEQLDLAVDNEESGQRPVVAGGPVSTDRGFVVHSSEHNFDSTLKVATNIAISFSLDAMSALAEWPASEPALFGLGYAGWEAGQLENELLQNTWLTAPATTELLFATPFAERGSLAAKSIGVDLNKLLSIAGHD